MQTIFVFDLELQSEISRVPKHSSDVIGYSAKPNLTLSDSRFISEHFQTLTISQVIPIQTDGLRSDLTRHFVIFTQTLTLMSQTGILVLDLSRHLK